MRQVFFKVKNEELGWLLFTVKPECNFMHILKGQLRQRVTEKLHGCVGSVHCSLALLFLVLNLLSAGMFVTSCGASADWYASLVFILVFYFILFYFLSKKEIERMIFWYDTWATHNLHFSLSLSLSLVLLHVTSSNLTVTTECQTSNNSRLLFM